MDKALIEAFWHAPHRLFWRKLKPLTLRHCFVLATADNPLVCGGRIATIADIVQAVEICSRDSRFFLEGRKPSWLATRLVRIAAGIESNPIGKFMAYLRDYSSGPEVWKSEGGKASKCHFSISIVAGLGHWMSIPPDRAWEMTPGEANWLLAAAIEQSPHGSIDIASEEEMERYQKMLDDETEGRAA